jgi:hypothetical protein
MKRKLSDDNITRVSRNLLRAHGDGKEKHCHSKLRPVYKLAQEHCANWQRDGSCVGVNLDVRTGRHFRWLRAGCRCLLSAYQCCPYFEESVLPMEKRSLWPTSAQGEAFRKAARLYHSVFPETIVVLEIRKCPDCGKRPVEARKRYCSECRKRRRKSTDADNHRNWRKAAAQRHTVKQNGSSLGAASRGTVFNTRCPLSDNSNFDPLTV